MNLKVAPKPEAMVKAQTAPKMTLGQAVLVELMSRYLEAVMDPFITLLEIHKLMYFMQEAGKGFALNYEKATYGPYATNLRHVLSLCPKDILSAGTAMPKMIPKKPIELPYRA